MLQSRVLQECTNSSIQNGAQSLYSRGNKLNETKSNSRNNSAASLRNRRMERYSREEDALTSSLKRCKSETSTDELQIAALERAVALLAVQICEGQERITGLREKLEDENLDKASFDALLRKRWMEERMVTRATEENQRAKTTLGQLKNSCRSCVPRQDKTLGVDEEHDAPLCQNHRRPKSDANFALFLQKSPTLRPLRTKQFFRTSQPRAARAFSQDTKRLRERSLTSLKIVHSSQGRSQSLLVDSRVAHPFLRAESGITSRPGSPSHTRKLSLCSSTVPSLPPSSEVDDRSDTGRTSHTDLTTKIPSTGSSRTTDHSSLTICDERAQIKHSETVNSFYPQSLSSNSKLRKEAEPMFGNIAIWQTIPLSTPSMRSRSRLQVLDNIMDVTIPNYAQNLMDSFVQRKISSLQLTQPSNQAQVAEFASSTPSFQNALTPVQEGHVSGNTDCEISSSSKPRPPSVKAERKRRSIFSLQLPRWSTESIQSPGLASTRLPQGQLDAIPEDATHATRTRGNPRGRKGLPSTQLYDLSQLDAAPDDILSQGIPIAKPKLLRGRHHASLSVHGGPASDVESSPRRNSALLPIAALKRVGSRFSMLGRS